MSIPRRTDEDSTQALFRLQTEPERENPATRAATSQVKPLVLAPVRFRDTTSASAATINARPGTNRRTDAVEEWLMDPGQIAVRQMEKRETLPPPQSWYSYQPSEHLRRVAVVLPPYHFHALLPSQVEA